MPHVVFDPTISIGSVLVLAGFLLSLTRLATRTMIREEFDRHSVTLQKALDGVAADNRDHSLKDDHRFERLEDRIETLRSTVSQLVGLPADVSAIRQQLEAVDGRQKEHIEAVEAELRNIGDLRHKQNDLNDTLIGDLGRLKGSTEGTLTAIASLAQRVERLEHGGPSAPKASVPLKNGEGGRG